MSIMMILIIIIPVFFLFILSLMKLLKLKIKAEKEKKRFHMMVNLFSKVLPSVSAEEFMEEILDIALKLVPECDRGSIGMIEGEKWKFIAVRGYSDELKRADIDARFMYIPSDRDVTIVDKVHTNYNMRMMPKKLAELFERSGSKDIIKSIAVTLRIGDNPIGTIFVDSTKETKISKESLNTVFILGKLASTFLMLKMYHEKELKFTKETIKMMINLLEMRDKYTKGHSERVAKLCVKFVEKLGLSRDDLNILFWSGMLHDIGKLGVPEYILNKPAKLTEEEYSMVKEHPILGENLMKSSEYLKKLSPIIRHHHERWDGKGYPDGLKDDEIPFLARILSVVDAFDAMTSERAYRKAMSFEEALREIEDNAGKQFDPYLAKKFLEFIVSLHEKVRVSSQNLNLY